MPRYGEGKVDLGANPTNATINDDGTFTDDYTKVWDDLTITPKGAKVKNIFEDMTPEDMASASYTVGRMFTSLEDTIAAAADGEATMEEAATIGKETEEPVVEEEATEEPAPEDVIEEIPEEESAPEEPVEEVEEEDEEIVEEVPEDVPPVIEEIEDYLDGEPEEVPEEATAEEKKKTYIQTHLNSFTGTGPSKTLEEGGRELEY